VRIEHIAQNATTFATIIPYAHEKNLIKVRSQRRGLTDSVWRTSFILDFKKGFLMYQVEIKKVRTKVMSSNFPAISNLSGDILEMPK